MNVVIAFTVAVAVFNQFAFVFGYGRNASMAAGLLSAVAVHAYIFFQPQIKSHMKFLEKGV